jgi:hypothetical protein
MKQCLKMLSAFIICGLLFPACSSGKQTKVNKPEKKAPGANDASIGGPGSEGFPPPEATPPEATPPEGQTDPEEKPEENLPGEIEGETPPETSEADSTTTQTGGSGIDISTLSSNPIGGLLSLMQNPQGAMKAILSSLITLASGSSSGGNTGNLISGLLGGANPNPAQPIAPSTQPTEKPNAEAPLSTPSPSATPTPSTTPTPTATPTATPTPSVTPTPKPIGE